MLITFISPNYTTFLWRIIRAVYEINTASQTYTVAMLIQNSPFFTAFSKGVNFGMATESPFYLFLKWIWIMHD